MSNANRKQSKQDRPEVVTLTVHDLNNLGCGVARMPDGAPDGGLVVFIKGAVTGDVVRIHNDEISPMLGPSGVSMGQRRP